MPYTITIESYQEFSARHGNRPLRCGNVLLFADGAMCNPDDGNLREEPPRDPVESLHRQLRYWREAVRRSTADFTTLRGQCSQQAQLASRYSNLPGPSNEALADLHKLQSAVMFCREKVAELEKALADKAVADPESHRQQCREQYDREDRARAAQLIHEIQSITL